MTYAFRDWLDPETLSAIVDDRPDMGEWLRCRAVSTRAIAVPAPRLAVLRHRSLRLRASRAIAIAFSGAATPATSKPSTGVGRTSWFSVGGRIGRTSGGNAKASGFDSSPAAIATASTIASVALALFTIAYFAAEMLRRAL